MSYEIGSADWYMTVEFPHYLARFTDELSGEKGDFWAKDTRERINRICNEHESVVDGDGAVMWKSNGRYVDPEICALMVLGGKSFSVYETIRKHVKQTEEFLAEYRSHPHVPSGEDLAEMRAAFGEGETVVNVITGEVIQL